MRADRHKQFPFVTFPHSSQFNTEWITRGTLSIIHPFSTIHCRVCVRRCSPSQVGNIIPPSVFWVCPRSLLSVGRGWNTSLGTRPGLYREQDSETPEILELLRQQLPPDLDGTIHRVSMVPDTAFKTALKGAFLLSFWDLGCLNIKSINELNLEDIA